LKVGVISTRGQLFPGEGRIEFKHQAVEQSPVMDRDYDLAIAEQSSNWTVWTVSAG
jgi:hypothetical protein